MSPSQPPAPNLPAVGEEWFPLAPNQRGQPRMIVGTPVLNRTGQARRRTIGIFAGILPVIVEPEPQATVREAIRQIAANLREAYRHRRFPLSEINRSAGLVASGRAQLFDVTLADPSDRAPLEFFSEVADVGSLLDVFGWDRKLAGTLPLDENGRLTDEPAVVEFVRRLLMDNGMIPYNASPDQIARVVSVWRAAATAQAVYRPAGPVNAPITLFLARTVPTNVIRGEQRLAGWGWDQWTRSTLTVEVVPGNHVNMLIPPFVREVGQRLAQALAGRERGIYSAAPQPCHPRS